MSALVTQPMRRRFFLGASLSLAASRVTAQEKPLRRRIQKNTEAAYPRKHKIV